MEAGRDIRAGDVVRFKPTSEPAASPPMAEKSVRVMQWNIERGAEFRRIAQVLKDVNADVLCLQELDIGCERSSMRNVPQLLADELGMEGYFLCEFQELEPVPNPRKAEHAAGPHARHGNAIFTRLPVLAYGSAPHTANLDWAVHGAVVDEPRIGARGLQWVKLQLPEGGILHVYSSHFEVFCGPNMRVQQFVDMLKLAERHRDMLPKDKVESFKAIFCGDFNTMAHGIVRFSPKYARDRWRYMLWGETEGEWFGRHFIDGERSPYRPGIGASSGMLPVLHRSLFTALVFASRTDAFVVMRMLERYPLADPFDIYNDVTLNNPAYKGFVQGKFDWLLATRRTLCPQAQRIVNKDYRASDHAGLVVDYSIDTPVPNSVPSVRQPAWRNVMRWGVRLGQVWIAWAVATTVIRFVASSAAVTTA